LAKASVYDCSAKVADMNERVSGNTITMPARFYPMRRLILTITVFFAYVSAAWAAAPGTLTSVQAIRALTNAEASNGLPVAFEATVTYYRGYEHNLFVQDGDAAIYVTYPNDLKLVPGDRVLVQGKTRSSFNPIVRASSVTLVRHGVVPKPEPANFDQMIRAETDCKLVTVRGVIRTADRTLSAEAPVHFMRLQLLMEGGYFNANVDSDEVDVLESLLDAEVELTGVASEEFDSKMNETGILMHVQSLSDVRIIKRASSSPWTLPATPMDRVITAFHRSDSSSRIRVHGTITYYLPGSAVVLQDGAKSIWIATLTRKPLRVGDAADATGFPDNHDGFLNLMHGEVRDTLTPAPVTPLAATWETMSPRGYDSPGHHDDLVSIEGQVETEVREASQDELVLAADGKLFSAIYRHPDGPVPATRVIPLGSHVRVTGICVLEYSNAFTAHVPFNILLRSYDDIVIVARPSLINTRNLLIAVGLLLLIVFVVIARGWALEHKVRRQTAAMSAQREAEAELERHRSSILEDINGSRPLAEILEKIAEMVSSMLEGAPCWCEVTDGARLGDCPTEQHDLRIVREEIPARSGPALGALYAGLDPRTPPRDRETLALQNGVRLATLAIETRRLYSDLRRRSEFDLLTDIHNRFAMEKFIESQIEEARHCGRILGLIYIDLDKFKPINDTYGHHVGDLFLQAVVARMSRQLLGSDMLARLGGDEFAALVSLHHGRADLDTIVARLEHCFDDPYVVGGYLLHGEASIGVALYPEDGATTDSLLSAADASMYEAKHRKRQAEEKPV
jgi:diguanylate cyclase (GGDEF)-like protein